MKSHISYLLLAIGLTILVGCKEQDPPPPVVVAESPAQTETLSKVSAAVGQIRKDNQQNADGPAKQAVDLQARIAQSGLGEPTEADAKESAETSALVFAGEIAKAESRATRAEVEAGNLRKQWQADQAASKERIDQIIADYERRIAAAQAEADRKAYLMVVSVFAVIGGAITLVGIGCAVTGWSRIGIMCIPGGIIIGGSGLLWGKVWFLFTIGGGVLLCAVAAGIYWAVRVYEGRRPVITPAPEPGATTSAQGATPGG